MHIRQFIVSLKRSPAIFLSTTTRTYSFFPSEDKDEDEKRAKNARYLKKWRNTNTLPTNESFIGMFTNNDSKNSTDDSFLQLNPLPKSADFIGWYKNLQMEYFKWCQRFIQERHDILGDQLAVTHFVLYRGGRVKQKGVADYLCRDDLNNIPSSFTANWIIDEIDFSNSEICYEGLDNFRNLRTIRKVSFKGCKYFDDWCLEKIMTRCPNIEYLDVSDCKNVTERGIEGLYRSWHLKNVVLTDFGHGVAFELTCLMLEDCMPGLKIEIIKAPIKCNAVA